MTLMCFFVFLGFLYSILESDIVTKRFAVSVTLIRVLNLKFKAFKSYVENIDLFNIDEYSKIYKLYWITFWVIFFLLIPLSFLNRINIMINLKLDFILLMGFLMLFLTGFETRQEFEKSLSFIFKIIIIVISIMCFFHFSVEKALLKDLHVSIHSIDYSLILIGFLIAGKQVLRLVVTIISVLTAFVLKLTLRISLLINNEKPITGFCLILGIITFIPNFIEMLK